MKSESLIKQTIKQTKTSKKLARSPKKKVKRHKKLEHPNFGQPVYNINIVKQKYVKSNAIIMSILSILLILTLVRFILTFNHWLVITIASTASFCCMIWVIFAVKRSMLRVELCIYEKYLVKCFEDSYIYCKHNKMIGYKIKTSLLDRMFKPKTKTLIVYYNSKTVPNIKMSCIKDNFDKIIELLVKLSQNKNSQQ